MKKLRMGLLGILTAVTQVLTALPAAPTVQAASTANYPAELIQIATADNALRLNIAGTADKSPLETEAPSGTHDENWRFDYVGTDSKGACYKIINQGTGRAIVPMGYETADGTQAVLFGSENNAAQCWYVEAVQQDAYGHDLYYKITNYNAPDMALTHNAAGGVSLSAYSGATEQKWLLNAAGLQGFAGYARDMQGNVKASAIGGALGEIVEVDTFDELKTACTTVGPMTIIVTGDIIASGSYTTDSAGRYRFNDGMIYMQPDKTIIGSYEANTLYNVYFRTYDQSYGPGHNIILRNLNVTHDKDLNNDNIFEFAYGTNFWMDHLTFTGHDEWGAASTGQTDNDKFLNFKIGADLITISDCKFGLHEYGVLLGYPMDTEDAFQNYDGFPLATLTNNFYENTYTRAPGLMRYGYYHSLNNYVYNFAMAYTVHSGSDIFAENCYYDGGATKGNVVCDWNEVTHPGAFADSGSYAVNCNRTGIEGLASVCTWRPSSNYTYKSISAQDAKVYCETWSGCQSAATNVNYMTQNSAGVPSPRYAVKPDGPMDTQEPTEPPTDAPTEPPTAAPTNAPTEPPTAAPTDAPTEPPTNPVTVAGDVNADGSFSVLDLIALQKGLLGVPVEHSNWNAADLYKDGIIDVYDLGMMKRLLLL